jgi:peptidoglycan/LPS O-acetylase OafA/YrhL
MEQLALLVVAIVLAAIIFYISGALVSQDWSMTAAYALRILVVSLIAVVVIPVFRDAANQFGLGDLGLLFAFVLLIMIVRFVLIDELTVTDDWLAAIVLSLIAVVLIYIVDEVSRSIFDVNLLTVL